MIKSINPNSLLFDDARAKIVFNERRSTYVALNQSRKTVEAYRIDGVLIIEGMRCDHGLAVPCDEIIFLIELKGSDLAHACDQISATIDYLHLRNICYPFHARIVLSKASGPDLESIQYKKLSRKIRACGGSMKQKTTLLEENI